jgi:hypothetical protein
MEFGMFADSRLAEFRECGCGDLESGPFLRGGISYRVSRPVSYASQLKLLVRAPASQGVQGSDWHKLGMSFTGWRSYLEVEAWSIHSFHADLA